jgi:predicted AAA+ superfamily ATPase
MIQRPLYQKLWEELASEKSMIFLAGPRQSGKTTLSRMIASKFSNSVYFNWDLVENKKKLIERPAFFEEAHRKDASAPLVIFDEIHKYKKWKNYLKGIYDQFSEAYRFLVLGSGRLNVFQKGGDSLAGRYFMFTLWPLTLAELADRRHSFDQFIKDPLMILPEKKADEKLWEQLSLLSGFPEPYVSGKDTVYRRWSNNYRQQLIREDIRNMTQIKDIDSVEILFSMLSSKVGSPLSLSTLAQDLQVSFNSINHWLEVFESFFLIFRVPAWEKRIARAITKEKKLYLYDYAQISSLPARFENMVALELLRAVSNWNDLGLGNFGLSYVRNKEKEEVDFLITRDLQPFLLVETKLGEDSIPKSLFKFQSNLNVPAVQLINKSGWCKIVSNGNQKVLVVSACRWLTGLP